MYKTLIFFTIVQSWLWLRSLQDDLGCCLSHHRCGLTGCSRARPRWVSLWADTRTISPTNTTAATHTTPHLNMALYANKISLLALGHPPRANIFTRKFFPMILYSASKIPEKILIYFACTHLLEYKPMSLNTSQDTHFSLKIQQGKFKWGLSGSGQPPRMT